ncbi:MAG: hypothetical protein ACK4GE_04325 [Caldimicrobium sp.]
MGAVAGIIGAISNLFPVISLAASIFGATRSVSAPKIVLPRYQIPTEDLELLKKHISANTAISDTARQVAIEALERYRAGTLSPTYQALYTKWYEDNLARLKEELARRGFTEGSTVYNEALARFEEAAASMKANLLERQLQEAMKTANLSETTINELLSKWQVESGITAQDARNKLLQEQLRLGYRQIAGQTWAALGEGLARVGSMMKDKKGTDLGVSRESSTERGLTTTGYSELTRMPSSDVRIGDTADVDLRQYLGEMGY